MLKKKKKHTLNSGDCFHSTIKQNNKRQVSRVSVHNIPIQNISTFLHLFTNIDYSITLSLGRFAIFLFNDVLQNMRLSGFLVVMLVKRTATTQFTDNI